MPKVFDCEEQFVCEQEIIRLKTFIIHCLNTPCLIAKVKLDHCLFLSKRKDFTRGRRRNRGKRGRPGPVGPQGNPGPPVSIAYFNCGTFALGTSF